MGGWGQRALLQCGGGGSSSRQQWSGLTIFESSSKYFFGLTLQGKEKWACTSFDPNNLPSLLSIQSWKWPWTPWRSRGLRAKTSITFSSIATVFTACALSFVLWGWTTLEKLQPLFTVRDFGAPVSRVKIPSASSWPLEWSGYHVPTTLAWINTCAHLSSVNIILFPIPFSFFHLYSKAQGTSHPFLWHLLSNLIFLTTLVCDTPSILLTSHQAAPIFQRRAKLNHRDKEATCSQNETMKKPMQSAIGDRTEGGHWESRTVGLESDICSTSTSATSYLWPLASQSLGLLICKIEGTPTHTQWSQQWNHVMTAMGLALLQGNVRKLSALETAHRHTCHVPNVWCVQ